MAGNPVATISQTEIWLSRAEILQSAPILKSARQRPAVSLAKRAYQGGCDMPDRIFVLNGHPAARSLSRGLAEAYADGATAAGRDVRVMHLDEMRFDQDAGGGSYRGGAGLDPDLQAVADGLAWAEHIVLATPLWWGGVPAKQKAVWDRVLAPGFAMDPRDTRMGLPKPLLTGRSARLLLTSDSPDWYLRLVHRRPIIHAFRGQVFGFVGIKPMRVSHFSPVQTAHAARIERWLGRARRLGAEGR